MEREISEEEMQKLSAFPRDALYCLCDCVNYLYNEIKKLKAKNGEQHEIKESLNNPIYTITTIEVDKKESYSSSRCVGFYYDLNEAKNAVEENRCDIFETCYLYAVIEETYAGIYPEIKQELWFKYNLKEEKYEKCEKPEFTIGYGGYGIG